jgi:hypothetical protein
MPAILNVLPELRASAASAASLISEVSYLGVMCFSVVCAIVWAGVCKHARLHTTVDVTSRPDSLLFSNTHTAGCSMSTLLQLPRVVLRA